MPQADSSYSRTYLSRSNNPYQSIHRPVADQQTLNELRARNEQLRSRKSIPVKARSIPRLLEHIVSREALKYSDAAPTRREMALTAGKELTDEQIEALPLSSDDELESSKPAAIKHVPFPTPSSTQSPQSKRPLRSSANQKGSKRRKTDMEKSEEESSIQNGPALHLPAEIPDWLSQSSQKRASNNKYKKQLKFLPTSPQPSQQDRAAGSLAVPDLPRRSPPAEPSQRMLRDVNVSNPREVYSTKLFKFDDDNDHHDQKGYREEDTITNNSRESVFSKVSESRRRRGSSSSLSSADSIASIQLDQKTKARLKADEGKDTPDGLIYCPQCNKSLLRSKLNDSFRGGKISQLSPGSREALCQQHRIYDAKLAWKEAHYPEINFDGLSTSADVQKSIEEVLIPMIKRQTPSYYLSKLDAAAKGPLKKANAFFTEEAMNLIHLGYYGPNGAKILSKAILENSDVSKLLKRLQRTDKAVRVAGVGRYIDCVLLPELMVRLVVKDMYLADTEEGQEQARKVLKQSSDLGVLLCGDDDEVVEEEESLLVS